MTKSDIINEVSSNTGLTKVEIEAVLGEIIDSISGSLKRGERVDIRGFGSFIVKKRKRTKMNTHKRKKRLRANRHKKKNK